MAVDTSKHISKTQDIKTYQYPSRLVSVEKDYLCLVSTEGWADSIPYATLSHCWGNIDFLKLTTKIQASFLVSIPISELSQTFRDAIEITRQLGVQFLWIDSLCIIQDDPKDWELEASKMGAVYRGSHINIAASAARDGNQGCFQKQRFSNLFSSTVRAEIKQDNASKFYAFINQKEYSKAFKQTIPASHLASRGWALQERLLAPRTLHFGGWGVFWECKTKDACETFPDHLPEVSDIYLPSYLKKSPLQLRWSDIVELYSTCSLTYSCDKLAAISGIPHTIYEETNDQYLAGLWRKNLEFDLCWMLYSPPDFPRSKDYRAPSWSWASMDSACGFQLLKTDPWLEVHVIDAYVTPSGPDSFGQVCGGAIRLSCPGMLSGMLFTNEQGEKKLVDTFSNIVCDLGLYVWKDCEKDDLETIYVLPIVTYPDPWMTVEKYRIGED